MSEWNRSFEKERKRHKEGRDEMMEGEMNGGEGRKGEEKERGEKWIGRREYVEGEKWKKQIRRGTGGRKSKNKRR